MHGETHWQAAIFHASWSPADIAVTLLFLMSPVMFLTLTAQPAQAQTFNVIYNFTGSNDGAQPWAGLTLDTAGNLYGTTEYGGHYGYGSVFRLSNRGGAWNILALHSFGGDDGANPYSRVRVAADGSLYGMAQYGMEDVAIFRLRPTSTACGPPPCPWNETVLYVGTNDGPGEDAGDVTTDAGDDIYGVMGGYNAYELTPSYGGWTYTNLHSFQGPPDGRWPWAGMIFDAQANLDGTTFQGGTHNWGTVFRLTHSENGWSEQVLYSFRGTSDGGLPMSGLTMDASGNFYGTTTSGNPGGAVFELTYSNGGWTLTPLHQFAGGLYSGPDAGVVVDAAGNVYGTKSCYLTGCGGTNGYGLVFGLTPTNGGWAYRSLHDFSGGSDGGDPHGAPVLGANGHLYGTTNTGGAYGSGVVWEITP